ncbi:MAG TPA: tRNA lysidine(34) synthetase TilS [Erysipelotrichaceae bacterium]|jgi:tRNA(Ile)-lysidine synthase|nr:tRNA lysidine(34) synthetase TilS [Erysipelotrichaceae bacterium]HQA84789.1 tRNA lysidine(34) synthetase TilS [Erysipelotrichaceae bacterium]
MSISLNLSKEKKYLVAVSGGCDSMMLLSLCVKEGYDLVVCHVNYKLRISADRDERIVRDFCQKHKLSLYVDYPVFDDKGNFQAWAREKRYNFFKEIYDLNKCEVLLLAHHLDDGLENYLMSKERNSKTWYYGISEDTYHHGMRIIRPLMNLRKKEIEKYCLDNKIDFGLDETNLSSQYTRNRIRYEQLDKMSDEEIKVLQSEMKEKNKELKNDMDYIKEKYNFNKEIEISEYLKENENIKNIIVRFLLKESCPSKSFSSDFIDDLKDKIKTSEKGFKIKIDDNKLIVSEYGLLYCCKKNDDFKYVLNEIEYLQNEYFTLANKGETIQQMTLSDNDFPLTIRNYQSKDKIQLRYGHKKVNRFLIDRKVLYKDRIKWPVIENKDGQLIFVKDIGCDVNHYSIKPNLFMVK